MLSNNAASVREVKNQFGWETYRQKEKYAFEGCQLNGEGSCLTARKTEDEMQCNTDRHHPPPGNPTMPVNEG